MKHGCGLDVTFCGECMTELEVGQVGICEDCTLTTDLSFDELTDTAKQKARENYTSRDYPYDDWHDGVYEDANRVAKILGLDIESTRVLRNGTGTVLDINISFSGFWSQGDGASFRGSYCYNPKAVNEINAYCEDKELIRIASELTAMQIAQRLLGYDFFTARITTSGNYSHSHSMNFEIHDWGTFADDSGIGEVDEDKFAQLMRDFADWIYKSLENEHDYLCSDEIADERLVDEIFDGNGNSL